MPDYSNLLKVELVNLLNQRDNELQQKVNELQNKQNEVNQKNNEIQQKNQDIQVLLEDKNTLQSTIDALLNQSGDDSSNDDIPTNSLSSANAIVNSIIELADTEKDLLPYITRTTDNGIKAYTIFLHGVGGKQESVGGGTGPLDEDRLRRL